MQTHFFFHMFTSYNSLAWTLHFIQFVSPVQFLPWACSLPTPSICLGCPAKSLECSLFSYVHPFLISYILPDWEEVVSDRWWVTGSQLLSVCNALGTVGNLYAVFNNTPIKKKFFFNVYLFLRERQSVSRGEAEREGDTESEAGSRPWAVSTEPDTGLKPTNHEIMTWAEVRRPTDWATQVPQ